MLTTCPECELQISDKALACPHCGYPLKDAPRKYQAKKHQRLPNGFGQITELKNRNLRNRFRVMISDGKTEYGKPIQKLLKPRAYFSTYKEAYEALLEYHKNPPDQKTDMTIEQLHNIWKEQSKNSMTNYKSAWNYCSSVYNLQVQDLRPRHIKGCISDDVPPTIKPLIKIMFNLMLDYAVEYEIFDRNYARSFEISFDIDSERTKHHIPFTDDEISKLWSNHNTVKDIDLILIQCYMGWRPQELCLLRAEDVNLDKNYIIGGLKTKAGRRRIVPIHPSIRPLIESRLNISNQMGSAWFIPVDDSSMTYHQYRKLMNKIVTNLGLNSDHKPHDPRKHFVTIAKKYGLDEYAIKRIVGHTITDITEAIYTDRDPAWLYNEVCKIPSPTPKTAVNAFMLTGLPHN